MVHKKRENIVITGLSVGRTAVVFSTELKRNWRFIIDDHLDMGTVELLVESLCKFEGALVIVSHDIWFLNQVIVLLVVRMTTTMVRMM